DYRAGCPSWSAIADGFNGFSVHLANHDVMMWAVSRAPLAKLQAYKRRMGWTFPWASSFSTDFNTDFSVRFTEEQQREGAIDYNYRREGAWQFRGADSPVAKMAATTGTDAATYTRERPGMSAFVLEDGIVYHTYSAYARGLDGLWGMYQWLDRAPKGRNETGMWWRRHDEYDKRWAIFTGRRLNKLCRWRTDYNMNIQPAANEPARPLNSSRFVSLPSSRACPQPLVSVVRCAANWKCPAAGRCP